jgi:penicillin-binding protein 1A
MNSPPPEGQPPAALPLHARLKRYARRAAIAAPALLLLYVLVLIPFTPSVADLRRAKSATPSVVMSADGVVLAEFKRSDREWVPLEKISPAVVDALLATEDRRFYDHHGIDVWRTIGALFSTLTGEVQGGSTITQQLARNLYQDQIGRRLSLNRKVKEAITALKIEALYTKREILETYLNSVPFLYNAFGIEMAALTYFDKSAAELNVLESATLVGMLKATSAMNPVRNPERATARRNLVLEQMAKVGKLTSAQAADLARRPLRLNFERQTAPASPVPHIVRHLHDWLLDWTGQRDRYLYFDGLVVRTTIDSRIQNAANKAVVHQLTALQKLAGKRDVLQAGFMAMDPRNGYVRAWVGSRDPAKEEFDHVSQARRLPGSVFKPFVYAAAFTAGLRPTMTLIDAPPIIPIEGGGVWMPKDVGAPSYQALTLRQGLIYSKNSITAQLMPMVGIKRVVHLAYAMGIRQSKLEPVLALALGTSPVTLREIVSSYSTIANGGNYIEPTIVTRIEDRQGRVLAEFGPQRETVPAMSSQQALELVDALRGVVVEGTGRAIRKRYNITADVAGKTGTTQKNTDGWFVMMHPQLVAGARVGFNQEHTMGAWGAGARSALPIVGEVFQQALKKEWIDSQARFGTPRTPARPAKYGNADPIADSPVVRELFGGARKQVQEFFRKPEQ